jgi:hypothetical protein
LDVSLYGGATSYDLADRPHGLGVAIMFCTAYETPALEGQWRDHLICRKPYGKRILKELLIKAIMETRART